MNPAEFYKMASEKGVTVSEIAEIIGKSEVTTLRKICNGGFKQSEIALLKDTLKLTDLETAQIFLR